MYLLTVVQRKHIQAFVLLLFFIFGLLSVTGHVAYGQESFFSGLKATGDAAGLGQDTQNVNLPLFIGSLIRSLFGFVGMLFMLLMFYGGFTWMTAGGNEESVSRAKRIITQAAIGLLVSILAVGISNFVFNAILQAQTVTTPPVSG